MKFSKFLAEAKGQSKVIVVYGGGFQPFHAGHMSSYEQAKSAFPSADFYVASSNDTKQRPIPFKDKQFLAQQAGVTDKFVQVIQPVNPKEILAQYNPKKDIFILIRSERDPVNYTKKDGSKSYFQPYKSLKECKPFDDKTGHGYIFVTKKKVFSLNGKEVYSGSQVREMYAKADDKAKRQMISQLYPHAKSP
jgi:cytidyltransferase-like protein